MIELTKRQKHIKKKYFKIMYHNPLHYCPLSDETFRLAPHNLIKVIDIIINILEQEEWDGITWVKTT